MQLIYSVYIMTPHPLPVDDLIYYRIITSALTPGYITSAHTAGYITPGYITPGYITPGYITPAITPGYYHLSNHPRLDVGDHRQTVTCLPYSHSWQSESDRWVPGVCRRMRCWWQFPACLRSEPTPWCQLSAVPQWSPAHPPVIYPQSLSHLSHRSEQKTEKVNSPAVICMCNVIVIVV